MVEISGDAQSILSKAGQGAQDYVLKQGGFGDRLTSGEATRLLSGFNPQASNVFSSSNIGASASGAYQSGDLLGIRESINQELGIPGLQETYQSIFGQLQNFDTQTETFQNTLRNRPESINQIRGRQQEASLTAATERAGLARQAEVAQSALLAAKQEAAERFSIQEQNVRETRQLILANPGAGITFADSPEQAARKIQKYNEKVEKESREQAKKDAFDTLYMQTFGTDRGKLSRKEAQKKLEKYFDSEKEYEKRIRDLEEQKLIKSLQGSTKLSATEQLIADKQDVQSEINTLAKQYVQNDPNWDGKLDPYDYNRLKSAWSLYNSPSTFDELYQGYINPNDISRYNITKTPSQLLGE